MDYEFIPLTKAATDGLTYTIGHAMRWRPSHKLCLQLLVSQAAIARDFMEIPAAKAYERPGIQAAPVPADNIREAVAKFPGGIAYFNASELGLLKFPIIVDGRLITKPAPSKALNQQQWEPLNEVFSFFVQYPDGQVAIEELAIADNHLGRGLSPGVCGFSAPYILKDGQHLPLKNPPPGQSTRSQEVFFPAGGVPAPISAIGLDNAGRVVRVSLVGNIACPGQLERLPTEYDLAGCLKQLNVVNALYAGGSADVQYYDSQTQTLIAAPERPKSADRKWLLRAGQTERGLSVIAMLVSVNHQDHL